MPGTPELPPLIVIAGATATGKTALALELARRLDRGAEIVSADSRQVYRGMDIGTAKATPAERAAVPHHGLDLVDPDEPLHGGRLPSRGPRRARGHRGARRAGLLVGGTGLYLRAVARGLPLEHGRRPTPRSAPSSRRASPRTAWRRSWPSSSTRDPAAAAASTGATPAASSAPSSGPS